MALAHPARRAILFVNFAHALDHYVLLIFPTAVIAIAAEFARPYDDLIWLATGAFIAFGLFSLPMGWLADRFGHRVMLALYYFGYGASCLLAGMAAGYAGFILALSILGLFSAIYHPIGGAMIAANSDRPGRDFGVNGVWGNLGAAFAAGGTAFLSAQWGWRAAFFIPGILLLVLGAAFIFLHRQDTEASKPRRAAPSTQPSLPPGFFLLVSFFVLALAAGGMTFNVTTIALPKIVEEGAGAESLARAGWIATAILLCGAAAQWAVGRALDRVGLPWAFLGLSIFQPLGLTLAALSDGALMLAGLVMTVTAIYGQIIVNDAMVATYVPKDWRNRAYGIRYFVGFTVSGLAVPLIALFYNPSSGFMPVLLLTAVFGAAVFLSALGFFIFGARSARQGALAS